MTFAYASTDFPAPESYIDEPMLADAWIAPDGTFYNVGDASHSFFARGWFANLGREISDAVSMLEDAGWLHLSGGWLMGASARNSERITEAQMDALMILGREARENTHSYYSRGFLHCFTKIMNGGTAY